MTTPSNNLRRLSTHLRARQERQTTRRLGVAKVLRETPDATNVELARIFDVDRDTIAEDRKFLMTQVTQTALTETQVYRENQLARIQEKWDSIEESNMSDADKHREWRGWMKLEVEIRGTAAPTKSITATVDLNPELSDEYLLDREAMAGLNDEQRHQVRMFAKSLPRPDHGIVIDGKVFQKQLPEVTE